MIIDDHCWFIQKKILILIYFCSSALSMRTNESKKNNRRFAQNRLQVSNPYDSKPFFYLLIRLDLFRICQQPFERVTLFSRFKKKYTSSMDHPWKKTKPTDGRLSPSDFHSRCLGSVNFRTTTQVSLHVLQVKSCPPPKIQKVPSLFFTTIIPISHVSRFLVHKHFSKPLKTVHIVTGWLASPIMGMGHDINNI